LTQDAELVALRVCEDHPRHAIALTDVDTGGAESQQALDLGVLIVWAEVEVDTVLDALARSRREEEDAGPLLRRGSNLELDRALVDHDPTECFGPPESETDVVDRFDHHLFPCEAHTAEVRQPVAGRSRTG